MIGDSLTADIAGGNDAGIDTVWYNPDHKENTSPAVPTYEVDSYEALLALLRKDQPSTDTSCISVRGEKELT